MFKNKNSLLINWTGFSHGALYTVILLGLNCESTLLQHRWHCFFLHQQIHLEYIRLLRLDLTYRFGPNFWYLTEFPEPYQPFQSEIETKSKLLADYNYKKDAPEGEDKIGKYNLDICEFECGQTQMSAADSIYKITILKCRINTSWHSSINHNIGGIYMF